MTLIYASPTVEANAFVFGGNKANPPTDIWTALRESFRLPQGYNHPKVQQQIKWLIDHPSYLQKVAKQSEPFIYYILDEINKRNLPGELALLPIIESSYDPFAYSGAGAEGLWQLMPSTGTGLGIKQDWWYDGRRDIYSSTEAALNYLTYLVNFFKGDWLHAIAAYDSGEGKVRQSIQHNIRIFRSTQFWDLQLPKETRAYIPRLLAIATIIRQPERYGFKLPFIANKPYFEKIEVHKQIDLAHAAELAEVDISEIYLLNPGFNRWATPPHGPSQIVLPIDAIDRFQENLLKIPDDKFVRWQKHLVKPGESLGQLAENYQTKSALIRDINHLKTNTIRVGQTLLIPVTAKELTERKIHKKREQTIHKAQTHSPQQVIYKVKKGDTMQKIAARYRLRPEAIRYWNQMRSNTLNVGDQLVLLIPSKRLAKANQVYVIKPGDTLGHIAKRFRVSTNQLRLWNNLSANSMIRSGQKLLIYS